MVCRVHSIRHLANTCFPECNTKNPQQTQDTQQAQALPSAEIRTLGKDGIAKCPNFSTRQRGYLPSALLSALSKWNKKNSFLKSKLFQLPTYYTWYSMLKFGKFFGLFAIFCKFTLKWFFWDNSNLMLVLRIMKYNEWKKWYSCYWFQCEALSKNWNDITNILITKTWPQVWGKIVLELYKMQMNLENYEICQDLMISYKEVMIKKIDKVLHNLWLTLLTIRSISEEESYSWEGLCKIWSLNDYQIRF